MIRIVHLRFDDTTGVLEAFTPCQTGGDDVLWSTTDTNAPAPWLQSPNPADQPAE